MTSKRIVQYLLWKLPRCQLKTKRYQFVQGSGKVHWKHLQIENEYSGIVAVCNIIVIKKYFHCKYGSSGKKT